jgi:hypothetical protein
MTKVNVMQAMVLCAGTQLFIIIAMTKAKVTVKGLTSLLTPNVNPFDTFTPFVCVLIAHLKYSEEVLKGLSMLKFAVNNTGLFKS